MVIAIAGLCLQLDPAGRSVRLALGSVAPTVVRAPEAESFAAGAVAWDEPGRPLPDGAVEEFGRLAAAAASPIDDVRGSAAYRRHAVEVLARRALLWTLDDREGGRMKIRTTVNGVEREADAWPGASLLTFLRDDLGLVGSKNACEQGECGSCSVWLDGDVVCSCLVPAVQADGAVVKTVEALADGDALHAVQEAFLAAGAVQCGFCTPGMVVAAADLLERDPGPERRDDPRGARRQPLPLHRLLEDPRRRPPRREGARVSATTGSRGVVGESARRIDGVPKVTGDFAFGSDLQRREHALGRHRARAARVGADPLDRRRSRRPALPASPPSSPPPTFPAGRRSGSSSATSRCWPPT